MSVRSEDVQNDYRIDETLLEYKFGTFIFNRSREKHFSLTPFQMDVQANKKMDVRTEILDYRIASLLKRRINKQIIGELNDESKAMGKGAKW